MQQSKDYLEREIEKLSQMLMGLIEKISGLSPNYNNDEIDEVNHALKSEFDFNISEICEMHTERFLDHISDVHETHLKHLAELLYSLVLKTEKFNSEQNYDNSKVAEKAILLIDALDEKSKTFSMGRLQMKDHLKTYLS